MKIARYIVTALVAFLVPASAFAAALTFAPASVTPEAGKTFTVTITADPAGAKAYTMRANVSFDPALVQFVSFAFAPKWVVLSQTGYDAEDNTTGSLIKTAGYPGGVTAPTVFGTVTFRAKTAGVSTIRATTDSLALDGAGKNMISGVQGTTQVTVAAPTPVQVAVAPVVQPVVKSAPKKLAETVAPAAPAIVPTVVVAPAPAVAAAAAAGFSFGSAKNLSLIALALVLIAVGFWYYRRRMN